VLWGPVLAIMAAIVYFDILNQKVLGLERLNSGVCDKVVHALGFGLLTFLLCRALLLTLPWFAPQVAIAAVSGGTVGFALFAESRQALSLAGHDTAAHLVADLVGVLAAAGLAAVVHRARMGRLTGHRRREVLRAVRECSAETQEAADAAEGAPRLPGGA
jgi:hypothetical protein